MNAKLVTMEGLLLASLTIPPDNLPNVRFVMMAGVIFERVGIEHAGEPVLFREVKERNVVHVNVKEML